MADNLYIYNQSRSVPKEALRDFNNGQLSGTDISPMWRIKKLTELFGPSGIGWYIDEIEHWSETLDTDVCVYVKIHLYIKTPEGEWSKPIVGIGGNRSVQQYTKKRVISDEAYKMAYTDAISVACKALGIGADVYWQNDATKYTNGYNAVPQAPQMPQPAPPQAPQPVKVKGQKKVAAAATEPKFNETLEFALQQLRLVQDTEGIKSFWKAWQGKLNETDQSSLLDAIHSLPFYPNK